MDFLIMECQNEFRKLLEDYHIYCKCPKYPQKLFLRKKIFQNS
jgi:hypothetical protein